MKERQYIEIFLVQTQLRLDYNSYDSFLTFFRGQLTGDTTNIIKKINVVAINYLWQTLMCMSFLGLLADNQYYKLLKPNVYGNLIACMRQVSFTDFDCSASTHFPIFKFKHTDVIPTQIFVYFNRELVNDDKSFELLRSNTFTPPKKNNLTKYSTSQAVVAIRMLKVLKENKVKGDFNNIHPRSKNPKGESNKCVDAILEFLKLNITQSNNNNIINTLSICTGLSTLKIIGDSSHSELGEIIQSGLNRISNDSSPNLTSKLGFLPIPKVLFLLQERPFLGRMCYMKRNFCLDGQPNVVKEIYPGTYANDNDYLLHFEQEPKEIIDSIKNNIIGVFTNAVAAEKPELKTEFGTTHFNIDDNGNLDRVPNNSEIEQLKVQYNNLMKAYQRMRTRKAIEGFDTEVDFQKYGGFWGIRTTSAINYKTIIDDFINQYNKKSS